MGARLREARIASGRDTKDLARELRIRDAWLLAIEDGRLDDLPAGPFRTGYVRSYANRLGLDGTALAARVAPEGRPRIRMFLLDTEGHLSGRRVLVLAAVLAVAAGGGWYLAAGSGAPPDRTMPMPELSRGPAPASPVSGEQNGTVPVPDPAAAQSGAGSAISGRSTETDPGPPDGVRHMAPALPTGEAAGEPPGPPNAERIRAVQRALARLGYDPGPFDGTIGPRTRAAIRAFQAASGLAADGKLTPELEREIRSAAAATGS